MKKKLLAILALAFTATLSVGATQAITASANAEPTAITLNQATITLDDTASVRMDAPYGIRFDAFLSAEQYAGLKKTYETVEVGMLICPTDFITEGKTLDFDDGDGLVLENAPEQNNPEFGYVAIPEEQFVLDSKTNTYTIHGALVGIHQNNLSRPFTARAYIRAFDSEGNEVTDAPVYSATTTSRAIYSVATYAVADPEVDFTGDKAACKTFLNEIIDEVQAYYGNLTVSVTSDNTQTQEYGILNDGDKVTVSATVTKNGDSTRVLDACPVLSTATESGITLTQTSKNEYVINGLNETGYNLSAAVGVTGETNTQTVSGVFTTPVKSWEKDIIDDVASLSKGGSANSSIVLQEEGDFAGAYAWSGYNQLWLPALSTGDIVRVDVNAQNGFLATVETLDVDGDGKRLTTSDIYNGTKYPQFSGTLTGTDAVDYVDFRLLIAETQEPITVALGNYKAEWITVELMAKRDFVDGELRLYHTTSGTYTFENFYIQNVKVQRYALGYELTYPTEFSLIGETESKVDVSTKDKRGVFFGAQSTTIAATGASATMSYQTTGDFAGAYKYSPNIYSGTAHTNNLSSKLEYSAFKGNATGATLVCQKDSYIYISLYQIKKYNLNLKVGGKTIYLYDNGVQNAIPAGVELKVYKYDTDGNPYTIDYKTNGDGTQSSLNMWVTYEIYFTEDATFGTGDFALYMYTRDTSVITGTENENYCYLRNVQFSATQKTLKLSDLQGA